MSNKKHSRADIPKSESLDNSEVFGSRKESAKIGRHRFSSMIIVTSIIFILVIILSVGFAFSWFAPRTEADLTVTTTFFETEAQYSIGSSEFAKLTDTVNIGVENFNSLNLRIKYTGPSSAYIRVQLFESFNKDGVKYPATDINYNLSSNWVKIGDYYYYKKVATYTEVTETDENGKNVRKRVPTEIPFVTGISSSYNATNNNGVYMNLVAVVEAVQPDRFQDFFLPEKDPVNENIDPDEFFESNS